MQIHQSQNILNWYPFKAEDAILQIGASSEELTKMFCKKCKQVTVVEPEEEKFLNFSKIENLKILNSKLNNLLLEEKYDIITLIGTMENITEIAGSNLKLEDIIKKIEKNLKPNGKILLAVDNKFGLRFFAGNPENILHKKFESLIGYNNQPEKIETFTKTRLERKLKELGYNINFYYPLPDYRIPNVIFSDRQLPKYTNIDKYYPYYLENSDIIMNEIDVFREILKTDKDMFTFFANSFLVEMSKGNCEGKFKYISYNNLRKPEYQLITKIADTYVEKQAIENKSEKHYENIKNNIKILQENGIETVDYIENQVIKSKYIKQECLLNNVLTKKLEEGNQEEFNKILENYIKIISKNSYKETDYEKTVFAKYEIEIENKKIIEGLHFLKNGLWDMTFKNCFFVEDNFLFFDQEWKEENLPYEYILYRSILYTISLRRFLKIEDLLEEYNLTQYITLFKKLDDKLQEEIRDLNMWNFYSENHFFDIDKTKQEVINLNIRSKAQIAAIHNLKAENEVLRKQNEELNNTFTRRVKRKIKKFIGGNNEQKN